jgi:hypothetical protein
MKKSTFIDYTVILAVLSNRKKRRKEKRNLLFSGILENVHLVANQHPAKAVAA